MTDYDFFLSKIQEQIDAQRARYAGTGHDFAERVAGSHNIGDFIGAVLAVGDGESALRFFNGHVEHIQRQIDAGTWRGREDAATSARMNVGWCYGEGMAPERVRMWAEATGSSHPMGYAPASTTEEMLEAGRKFATR